jgi:poly-gamma-glutamate synthesis protein (capsule biosynthesis protein)
MPSYFVAAAIYSTITRGSGGYEAYRSELVLAHVAEVEAAGGAVVRLEADPFRIERFRLNRASREETEWFARRLDRESAPFGVRVHPAAGRLRFEWGRT